MADISTKLAGVKMRTPFGVSPHNLDKPWFPGKKAAECFMKYVNAGAGYVYIPAIINGDPAKEEVELDFEGLFKSQRYVGRWMRINEGKAMLAHIYTARRLFNYLPWAEELIDTLKPQLPEDVPIIGQIIVHDTSPETWAEQAKKVEALGVDLIELNTGCPISAMATLKHEDLPPEAKWGMMMGVAPDILFPIFEAVVKAVKVPVGFKLTPESGFPRMMYIVEEAQKRGIKYVVTTHKYFAVAPPDIYNGGKGKFPAVGGANVLADVGGAALRFSMYKATGLISKNIPGIDCFAGGGITNPENVPEAIMLGAPAAQALTGIVTHGIQFLTKTNQFIEKYMDEMGYKTIEDFRGIGLKYLKGAHDVEFEYHVAKINEGKCTKCGKCAESYCPAISMEDNEPVVDPVYCSSCAMCTTICPFNAIDIVPR
jgi:dihydropyrimidine dehydrogenase (NAD+) subunit PreA